MRRNGVPASLLAAGLMVSPGCGSNSEGVVIHNRMPFTIGVSDNPDILNEDTKVGVLAIGGMAVATCIVTNEDFPDRTRVYIENDGVQGYIPVVVSLAGEEGGGQLISPGYDVLATQLPECDPAG